MKRLTLGEVFFNQMTTSISSEVVWNHKKNYRNRNLIEKNENPFV